MMHNKAQRKELEIEEKDFLLTIRCKSGKNIPESVFNLMGKNIESALSNGDFLIIVSDFDHDQYRIK